MRATVLTSAMTAAAAAVGTLGAKTDTAWYRELQKPAWQPPAIAFPLVWTPLYVTIGWGTGRLVEAVPSQRGRLLGLVAADLAANAGWNWAFFDRRSPAAGLGVLAVLDVLNAALLRESLRHDRVAAATLTPYAAWCGFATALNVALWRRNRTAGRAGRSAPAS